MSKLKIFTISVPYSEYVYGTTTYKVGATTLEEAMRLLSEEAYMHYYDSEVESSENYEEFFEDLKLEKVEDQPS